MITMLHTLLGWTAAKSVQNVGTLGYVFVSFFAREGCEGNSMALGRMILVVYIWLSRATESMLRYKGSIMINTIIDQGQSTSH